MKQLLRKILIPVLCSIAVTRSNAQASETARNTIQNFYKVYDSLNSLSFDVRYIYTSDTLVNEFTHEEISGTYTMNGNNARYNIGDVEYLQNDSFFVAVYTKQEMMVVSRPPVKNAGSFLPLRELLDSLLGVANVHYDISQDGETDSAGYLLFAAKSGDGTQALNRFKIDYEKGTNFIQTLSYDFMEAGAEPGPELSTADSSVIDRMTRPRRKTLTIQFSNYHFGSIDPDHYSQNNYLWKEDNEYKPVDRYKGFKVYNARD